MNDQILPQLVGTAIVLAASVLAVLVSAWLRRRRGKSEQVDSEALTGATRRRVVLGFLVAIAASLSWGVGNVLTRYSVEHYPSNAAGAIIDIAVLNYLAGSATLILVALAANLFVRRKSERLTLRLTTRTGLRLIAPAAFKAMNTYLFIAAVALISAASAATLENLQVLWTAIIASIMARTMLPASWFGIAGLTVVGTWLTLGGHSLSEADPGSLLGIGLAVLAGLTFSAYAIRWSQVGPKSSYGPQRALETGIFLILAMLMMVVMHYAVGRPLIGGGSGLLTSLSAADVWLQLANGTFNIGLTYFLMTESLRLLNGLGHLASLLLGLGISYSVLFTVLVEFLLIGRSVSVLQWLGLLVFTVGFAATRLSIADPTAATRQRKVAEET